MRVLLTGATGFVGAHLAEALQSDHDVIAIARRPPPEPTESVDWIRHDLAHAARRIRRFPDTVDAVVHLAQSRRYREFPDGAADVFALNVAARAELLEYARRAGAQALRARLHRRRLRYALAGSRGRPDPAGRGRRFARLLPQLEVRGRAAGPGYADIFHVTILRPFFVYGPGQRGMLIRVLADACWPARP